MTDILNKLKEAGKERSRLQQLIQEKTDEQQNSRGEIDKMEAEIRQMRDIEGKLRTERSNLNKLDTEIVQLTAQKGRLDMEMSSFDQELKEMQKGDTQ